MKFKFSLEKILNHRKLQEELSHKEFLEKEKYFEGEVEKLEEMQQQVRKCREENFQLGIGGGKTSSELQVRSEFIQGMKTKMDSQRKEIQEAQVEMDAAREVFIEAARDFKTLEKIKERKFKEFQKIKKKKLNKNFDEITTMYEDRKRRV